MKERTIIEAFFAIFGPRHAKAPSRPVHLRCGLSVFVFCLAAGLASGDEVRILAQPPTASQVLTNIAEIWTIPRAVADEEYPIKTEILIYFNDTEWGNASGECLGVPRWLPIFDAPYSLKAGERVAIDGVIIPSRERFVWSKTKIRILETNVVFTPQPISNLSQNPRELRDHLVSVEGLIDSELDETTHCQINFLSGNTVARAYVLKGTNSSPVSFKPGDMIRITAVYSPQFDRDGNLSDLSLWAGSRKDVTVFGSLATDSRFKIPRTFSRDIALGMDPNQLVRVEGVVRKNEPGQWVTIWDRTGQIMVQSKQSQPLRFGDRVEAIGYPFLSGAQQCLHSGLYRLVTAPANTGEQRLLPLGFEGMTPATNAGVNPVRSTQALPLCLAEQVRDLSLEEAAQHLPVAIRGVVMWAHSNTAFAYVQDGSGGVRVVNPKWDDPASMKSGTMVQLEGVTAAGDFVPVVTNGVLRRVGWWNIEGQRQVTFEQAMTGVEEGKWIEMQGYVRGISVFRGLAHFELSTSGGEFEAWTPAVQSFDAYKGAIVRLQGVCSVSANARHQLTGIQIWTPDQKYIVIAEPAPWDLFAVPLRPLASLRRFNMESTLNQRVRTSGTVVLDTPGHYLYVQDGADSVLALSQQTNVVEPGDRVEVVGFPGGQGQKFVLREAAYRRISTGKEPVPLHLSLTNSTDADLDGLLVTAGGVLLNKVNKESETDLLIRARGFTFEAGLNPPAAAGNLKGLELGSRLALTGVYEVQNDEYGKPRSFMLHLRSPHDIQLLQQPPWWTLSRLLWALVGTLVIFLIALVWSILITRKNRLLHQAQTELEAANDQLESRVQDRTRELREQIKAREQAHIELTRAQRDLMLASRQAGMAEMATGVLHNVGNVLNSVNVSTTLLRDQIRKSETYALVKATDLLKEKNGNLADFLTSDPKGKVMPEFFVQVAGHLQKEQAETLRELEQLTKNVDHIKDIIAMQQSYARVAGVVEKVSVTSLVEDALQINAAALARHDVTVTRRFSDVPFIMVDKHKVLQILINLIRNAKYALDDCIHVQKQITVIVANTDDGRVMIRVEDNGMGIPSENLTRIFSHGFTTRPSGHGFGLHIGALNAREMGGSLRAASDGPGCGAAFTLILPLAPPADNA